MKNQNKETLEMALWVMLLITLVTISMLMFRIEHILQNQIFRTNERIDLIEERLGIE